MPIQDYFRMSNLFGGKDDVLPSYPTYGSSDYYDPQDEFPATRAFAESVLNVPERTKPSRMRMLGTGLLSALQGSTDPASEKRGFWGSLANKPFNVDQTSNILNAPFEQKLQDWKTRTGALQQAANIESQIPARRALARQREAQADVIPQREQRMTREGEDRTQLGVNRLELDKQKLALNEWKARNPNGRVIPVRGGNVIVVNPQTGEALDTGISSGMLTEEERINLSGEKRLEQIGAQGTERRKTQEMIGDQALERIGARGEESRKTKQTIPGKAASATSAEDRGLSPTQQRAEHQNRVNQLVLEAPELADYVSLDPNTKGVVIEEPYNPEKHWSWQKKGKPTQEEYDEIYEYVYGKPREKRAVAQPVAPPARPETKTEPAKKAAAPSDKVIVQDKNGRKYSLPANQLQEAIKQGYTQVK